MYSIELQTVFYEYQRKNHKIKTQFCHFDICDKYILQNDKAKVFSEGGNLPLTPPPTEGETPLTQPLTLIKNEGEELIRKRKDYFLN